MPGFTPNRRDALKRMALLGAAGLVSGIIPIRSARAADLTAGFVYIGPRLDWGWNQSHEVAAAGLRGVPNVRVVEAGYLPESTDYGSGKETPETRAYTEAMEGLIADGAGLIFSTSFDDDPFLLAVAKKYPDVLFRQASLLAHDTNPPNVGSQNGLINQGHYVNGVAAGLCTATNQLGFVAGKPFGSVLLNVNSFLLGSRQTNPQATVRVIFTGEWEDAGSRRRGHECARGRGLRCHYLSPGRPRGRHRDGRGARRQDLWARLRPGPARSQGLHHRRRIQLDRHVRDVHRNAAAWRNPAELRDRRIRQGLCQVEPVRCRSDVRGDQRRQDGDAGDEERGRNFRRPDQGQHRQAGRAGGNDLMDPMPTSSSTPII